jgi:uncharacterized protein DUF2505
MKKFTLRHEINCNAEQFWKVFFDKDFNHTLFREELQFPEYETLEQSENDSEIRRRVRGVPKMNMPGPVKKLLGDRFGYEEEGTFDRKSGVWRWKMKANTMTDKLRNEGTVKVEPIDDKKCRRIAEIEMEAKVFGLGGVIESSSESEMRRGWETSAVFMNKWLKDHPPA